MNRRGAARLFIVLAYDAAVLVVVRGGLAILRVPDGRADAIMLVVGALLVASGLASLRRLSATTFRARDNRPAMALSSLCTGICGALLLWAIFHVSGPVAAVAGAAVTVAAGFWYRRTAVRDMDVLLVKDRTVEPRNSAEAQAMVDTARRARAKPDPRGERRMMVELNLARALMFLSMLDRQAAALDEARSIVQQLLTEPGATPQQALWAAADLFNAVDSYAKETGDGADYQAAMRIYEDLAREVPHAAPMIHEQRADHAVFQAESVMADPDGRKRPEDTLAEAARWLSVANDELDQAIRVATAANYRAAAQVKLGLVRAQLAQLSRSDFTEAERLVRDALPRLSGQLRVFGDAVLAQVLVLRADSLLELGEFYVLDDGDEAALAACLDEAERICRQRTRRATDFEPMLRGVLADALAARERMASGRTSGALEAARAAYWASHRYSNIDRTRAADAWCVEAVASGDPDEIAKAYWERVVAAAYDANRHIPLQRRRHFLAGDGVLAEAGFRVMVAGRTEDAVRLVEYGRGVHLRRLLGAATAQQRALLFDQGHGDLVRRYETAVAGLADLLREQQASPEPTLSTVAVGPRRYDLRGFDPIRDAQVAVRASEDAIAAVLGDPSGPLPFPEIQAAAATAPLIYIGAAEDCGYALIVGPSGPPRPLPLRGLRHDLAARLAAAIGTSGPAGEVPQAAVRAAVDELTPLLVPLAEAVRQLGKTVTLVPLGPLGLLPLHAVLVPAGFAVRHTPSARGLPPDARPIAATSTVLSVEAPHPCPPAALRDLVLVPAQVELLTGLYGGRLRRLPDAGADQVLSEVADVFHFQCHGAADPLHPYESSLFLSDRQLRLSEMLARSPRRQRLVILGACESSVPDPAVLDEMVSFPGALLQAGVQGVVAALWQVPENAAALCLQRVHEGLAAGLAPVTALADAQQWLRSATRGEIVRRYPGLYRNRLRADPADRPFAEPVAWAAFTYTGV